MQGAEIGLGVSALATISGPAAPAFYAAGTGLGAIGGAATYTAGITLRAVQDFNPGIDIPRIPKQEIDIGIGSNRKAIILTTGGWGGGTGRYNPQGQEIQTKIRLSDVEAMAAGTLLAGGIAKTATAKTAATDINAQLSYAGKISPEEGINTANMRINARVDTKTLLGGKTTRITTPQNEYTLTEGTKTLKPENKPTDLTTATAKDVEILNQPTPKTTEPISEPPTIARVVMGEVTKKTGKTTTDTMIYNTEIQKPIIELHSTEAIGTVAKDDIELSPHTTKYPTTQIQSGVAGKVLEETKKGDLSKTRYRGLINQKDYNLGINDVTATYGSSEIGLGRFQTNIGRGTGILDVKGAGKANLRYKYISRIREKTGEELHTGGLKQTQVQEKLITRAESIGATAAKQT